MTRQPERGVNPARRQKAHFDAARQAIEAALARVVEAIAFMPVVFYYYLYWQRKDQLRTFIKNSAAAFLTLSLALFIVEMLMKVFGHRALSAASSLSPEAEQVLTAVFVLTGVIVFAHTIHETRVKKAQTPLSNALWRMLFGTPSASAEAAFLRWLELTHGALADYGSTTVCIWSPAHDGLRVRDSHWFPRKDPEFLDHLPPGTGVAGQVVVDRIIRYVPRLYFPINKKSPSWLALKFFHAFEFKLIMDETSGRPDVTVGSISFNSVEFGDAPIATNLRSFVAVPITSDFTDEQSSPCYGVLCVTFRGTDPLDQTAIKTTAVLSLLLASELDRIHAPVTPKAGSAPG